ncbi:hypothetical protein LF41_2824 [Lysobacter dokdonensis DS-58]|uniref:DUF2007 domain-containing protein n=1 Tax=Lysobacter dokdonensis DS-58 TaxID=1300345 RepID=A0A0A2X2X2_9GAMM|nr:DUF2007 domain-containing protein [Lysobacter dokdonensis]KGQ19564.1 hypothetical protein LF41_2824 [Lysobacter dokdonensis DS-58]
MRVVYEAEHVIDAHLVRHALEAAGLPAFVRGEALLGGLGELGIFGLVQVCVPEAAWPEARAVVEGLALSADPDAAPEAPPLPTSGLLA